MSSHCIFSLKLYTFTLCRVSVLAIATRSFGADPLTSLGKKAVSSSQQIPKGAPHEFTRMRIMTVRLYRACVNHNEEQFNEQASVIRRKKMIFLVLLHLLWLVVEVRGQEYPYANCQSSSSTNQVLPGATSRRMCSTSFSGCVTPRERGFSE